jgi:hypothetical protein
MQRAGVATEPTFSVPSSRVRQRQSTHFGVLGRRGRRIAVGEGREGEEERAREQERVREREREREEEEEKGSASVLAGIDMSARFTHPSPSYYVDVKSMFLCICQCHCADHPFAAAVLLQPGVTWQDVLTALEERHVTAREALMDHVSVWVCRDDCRKPTESTKRTLRDVSVAHIAYVLDLLSLLLRTLPRSTCGN